MDQGPAPPAVVSELARTCVHCGLCLPTCPTYVLWAKEADSPRGRVLLMRAAAEEETGLGEMSVHFDRCLGCMACLTSCPSGVRYDRLLEMARFQVEAEGTRRRSERLWRRFLLAVLSHPARLRVLAPTTLLAARLRLPGALGPLLRRAPRLRALTVLAATAGRRRAGGRRPAPPHPGGPGAGSAPAGGVARGALALLPGCAQRELFPEVNAAAARVLRAEGYEVATPTDPRCCGALALHSGLEHDARRLARRALRAFAGHELVVTTAAGCGAAMKEYGALLAGDRRHAEQAESLSGRTRDVSEVLADLDPRAPRHPLPLRVVYHDACHLAHAQRIRKPPRALLASIPGLTVLEPAEWEVCCGSAGIYNLVQPDGAAELGERKARRLLATEADLVVAGNPGCALQIAAHLRALGRPLPVVHPVELLDASIRGVAAHELLEGLRRRGGA